MLLALVLALVLFLPACGGEDGDPFGIPDRAPDFQGVVEDVDSGGRILVVPKGDRCGFWVAVGEATVVDVDVEIEPDGIPRGRRARVWVNGPIAESCPAQTSASAVELVP